MERVRDYAFKTLRAMQNAYDSVRMVYPNALERISEDAGYYLGLKDSAGLTPDWVQALESEAYYLHTLDRSSLGGRALDLWLRHPVTGRPMTGSSSGTAMNVFLGLNDVGIGTDGGGSVLGPAAALNLFGCIHPTLFSSGPEAEVTVRPVKQSTDGIAFTPSYGLISQDLGKLRQVFSIGMGEQIPSIAEHARDTLVVAIDRKANCLEPVESSLRCPVKVLDCEHKYRASRQALIQELTTWLASYDLVISQEGPVDLEGWGDTLVGHFDADRQRDQQAAKKGYLRVTNMCQAFGLVVPAGPLSVGYLIMCRASNVAAIALAFHLAEMLATPLDPLTTSYFQSPRKYFEGGVQVGR